jgi:hypothetical protein
MARHQFLTDEWIDEVRGLKSTATDSAIDTEGLVVNATITGVPFGTGTLELHSDHGPMIGWQSGHSPAATVSMTVDYHTARALVLDASADMSVLDQATRTGTLQIDGDGAALRRWFSARSTDQDATDIEDAVRAITQ